MYNWFARGLMDGWIGHKSLPMRDTVFANNLWQKGTYMKG